MFSDWKGIPVGFISSLIIVLSSCETEIETNAPWKDFTVVYGILDPHDSVQYLKIVKGFLGEGNALVYAAEPDCSYYSVPLNVWIEEWTETGDSVKTLIFDTITVYKPVVPDQVFSSKQILYKYKSTGYDYIKAEHDLFGNIISLDTFWLNDKNIYKLKIVNPKTGKVVDSQTPLVNDFEITNPGSSAFIRFVSNPAYPKVFAWDAALNGGKYDFEVVFNYSEVDASSGDTLFKSIILISQIVEGLPGQATYNYSYWDTYFFTSCQTRIPYDDPVC